jgi:malto-oligosyltrehalose synthase
VNDLVALDMREGEAFEKVHELPFRLYEEGLIDGVRVDHVDGLADPGRYCRALRDLLQAMQDRRPSAAPAGPPYILVEKILLSGETLPPSWETDGTSGYDFMDEVSLLQHDNAAETKLSEAWAEISGRSPDFAEEEEHARRLILALSFSGHLETCAACFHRLARAQSPRSDVSLAALRRVLTELLAHFLIYRLYGPSEEAREHDRPFLEAAFAKARASVLSPDRFALDRLQTWLSEPLRDEAGHLQKEAVTRFQQLSAPVAAKAVEDTAGYRYGRLISRNDVGFDMARLGVSVEAFHEKMAARLQSCPNALLATGTHDHKRGEDVRARLAVLSECPEAWTARLRGWIARSRELRESVAGALAPSEGDIAILFQTLVGSWPLDLLADGDTHSYAERIAGWLEKASREAKLETDWILPNEAYEAAARAFVMRLLVERADPDLLAEIAAFAHRIAPAGAVNALAQTVLKLTVPGVPDLYQGTDYWDLSLVDPDNRRPVDFAARIASLEHTPLDGLAESWRSGSIKQHIIARILALRKQAPDLFAKGDYRPLEIGGRRAENAVAFARKLGEARLVVVVPRLVFSLLGDSGIGFAPEAWEDSWVGLDAPPEGNLLEILTRRRIAAAHRLPVAKLLQELQVAVLSNVSLDLH